MDPHQILLKKEWPHLVVIFVALSALYLWTAPRTVVLEDDGIFILSGWFLGIEHPPGYPLFVLLAKASTLLPFGSVAWRVHALNGLIAAGACVLVFLCARALIPGRVPAYFAAIGLGVSRTFWSQALIADVYPLNALIFFILLYLTLRMSEAILTTSEFSLFHRSTTRCATGTNLDAKRHHVEGAAPTGTANNREKNGVRCHAKQPRETTWNLYLFALVAGLGTANHWPLLALSSPGLLILLWPQWRKVLIRLPGLLTAFAIGLLPYGWMVWRSHMHPEISFQGSIDSWSELIGYLLRSGYSEVDNSLSSGTGDKLGYAAFLIRDAGTQLLPPIALLGLTGAIVQWRTWGTRYSAGLLAAFLGPTLFLLLLLDFDFQPLQREAFRVYPLVAWGILCLWAGLGLYLTEHLLRFLSKPGRLGAMAVILLAATVGSNWATNDRRHDWLAHEYASTLLSGLEPNALLLVRGDAATSTVGYLHLVAGLRPDVLVVSEAALVLEPKPFDPLTTPYDVRGPILDAFAAKENRPLYRLYNDDERSGLQTWLTFRPDLDDSSGGIRFQLPDRQRQLLLRLVAADSLTDGWSKLVRRALLARFASFATLAQGAGDWPKEDTELADYLDAALLLPEAALTRAELLVAADARQHRQEIDSLLEHVTSGITDHWIGKREQARFYNLIARLAQQAGNDEMFDQALTTSLKIWPGEDNPASSVLKSLRSRQRGTEPQTNKMRIPNSRKME